MEQENKDLLDYIKSILGAIKNFFKEILHFGNDRSKNRAVSEIKDYYDVKDFKKDDVYDMAKDTTNEKELYDCAKIDKHYKKDKAKDFDMGV